MAKKIAILAMGGTIAMTGESGGNVVPNLTGEALVAAVPALADLAEITAEQVAQKPSCALDMDDIVRLHQRIGALSDEGCDGVIVTQGTDAMEESAFLLDCLPALGLPVIMTGAMRNPSQPGADGPANLMTAAYAALHAPCADYGVLVAFDHQLHAARFVMKCDTVTGGAFTSPIYGAVGRVVENRVVLPTLLPAYDFPRLLPKKDAEVALHMIAIGEKPDRLVTHYGDYDGLVVAGLGAGHVPPSLAPALGELAEQVPVLLSSRHMGGQVTKQTYGYAGGEIDLQNRGLISTGWLAPVKARLLLSLMLASGQEKAAIKAAFSMFDGG